MSFAGLLHDVRTSVRGLSRRPLYPMVAVIILTLGLSAAVAVFTYMNGFYQPFPGVDADRLVRIFGVEDDDPNQDISYLDFLDYAAVEGAFEGVAAAQPYYAASVRLETMTEVAWLEAVSGDYFSVLGIEMSIGRRLSVDDDRPGSDAAAVISHAWWLRSFNGDSAVIGSTIYLNFRPFTVVGVAAPEFLGTASGFRPDVWIPFAPFKDRYTRWAAFCGDRDVPLVRVYGRLRDGIRESAALAALQTVAAGLDEAYPRQTGPRGVRLGAATWIDPRTRLAEEATVRLMMVGAGLLLLLVCANVANLLLSMALGRQREQALRAALGASPGRLLRQVLIGNLLLAGLAGGIALALAGPLGARLGSYFARPSVWGADVAREVTVDFRVVAFAVAIAVVTGLVAGLLPAIRASRRDLVDRLRADADLRPGGPGRIYGRRLPGMHDMLVAAQVALSVVLLVVAGLVLRSLVTAGDADPGFSYDRLVVTHISTSSTTLEVDERDRFFREVAARVGDEPWARAATVADYPLLSPHMSAELRLDGHAEPVDLVYSKVIPGFFGVLGIEVTRGRGFVAGDTAGAPDVAVVNEKLAQRFFAGELALGRRLWWPGNGGADRAFEIVGVVRDTKTQDFLADTEPTAYFSYPQHAYPTGSALLVATIGDPGAAVPTLYSWLRDFEPHLAIVNVVTYNDVVRGFLYTYRMNAEMFSALAFLGLALAAAGIFSVMSLAVNRRTREIGIRMSIGAQRSDIGRVPASTESGNGRPDDGRAPRVTIDWNTRSEGSHMPSSSRRNFLGQLLGGTAAALVFPTSLAADDRGTSWATLVSDARSRAAADPGDEEFWRLVKEQFPLRDGLVLMNAANLCPSPYPVQQAVFRYTRDVDADASFHNRAKFDELRGTARAALAEYVGADVDEIAITRNTSEGNNTVINGLVLGRGDEVVIWDQNHPTANVAWDVRADRYGYRVRRVATPPSPRSADELVEPFAEAITDNTRVLAFSHFSNISGVALPAKRLCAIARARGILTLVDGAQSFGAVRLGLHDMGCDFFTASAHKWFLGPKEAGILYVRRGRSAGLWPSIVGVGWEGAKDAGARKFETLGQRDDAAVVSMGTTVLFHQSVGVDRIEERVRRLSAILKDELAARVPEVRFHTPREGELSAGVVVFDPTVPDIREAYERLYTEHGVACAPRGGEFSGIRLCPHIYNTTEEIDRVVEAVAELK